MPRDTDPIASSVWMRPTRTRRGRPTLSREQIVCAAIELLDAEGLDGLSMRRLGATLGAGATSAYWYVANKDELLELVMDEVMGEVDVPDPGEVGWRAAAREFAHGFRAMLVRHPWIVGLFGGRPAIGPNAMRLSDRSIQVLTVAGFAGAEVAWASSALMSYAVGWAMGDNAMRTATKRAGMSVEHMVEQLEPYVQRLAADYPNYAGWWSQVKGLDMERAQEDGFRFGLERVLDGLEGWLDRRR